MNDRDSGNGGERGKRFRIFFSFFFCIIVRSIFYLYFFLASLSDLNLALGHRNNIEVFHSDTRLLPIHIPSISLIEGMVYKYTQALELL